MGTVLEVFAWNRGAIAERLSCYDTRSLLVEKSFEQRGFPCASSARDELKDFMQICSIIMALDVFEVFDVDYCNQRDQNTRQV